MINYNFVRVFDHSGKGYINARELKDGLTRLQVYVDPSDISLFV